MVTGEISLKIRQGFILIFLLVVALPILFFSIGKAYYSSLVEATENTLEAHLYSILAEVDFQEDGIGMPAVLLTPELNRLNSDTVAFIYLNEDKQLFHLNVLVKHKLYFHNFYNFPIALFEPIPDL